MSGSIGAASQQGKVVPAFGSAISLDCCGAALTVLQRRSICCHMVLMAALKRGLGRLPAVVILLAAFALVLHGITAPMAGAQMRGFMVDMHQGHDHDDCAGHSGDHGHDATTASTGHHPDLGSSRHTPSVEDMAPASGAPAVPHANHQSICCTPVGSAVLPQPTPVERSAFTSAIAPARSAAMLPEGILPEASGKPPRTTYEA